MCRGLREQPLAENHQSFATERTDTMGNVPTRAAQCNCSSHHQPAQPAEVSISLLRSLIRDEGEYFELEHHCFAGSGHDPDDLLDEAVAHFEWLGVAIID